MDIIIRRATVQDTAIILHIGKEAVELSHRASCSPEDMSYYMDAHYNEEAIRKELDNEAHIYHLIFYKGEPAGFSKIILNAPHANISTPNTTKLDRIYLLSNFFNQKLGHHLLHHNVQLSKENGQNGMWLFTWKGNERAVNFYKRNGFTVVGEHSFKVSETHYNPNYHMLLSY